MEKLRSRKEILQKRRELNKKLDEIEERSKNKKKKQKPMEAINDFIVFGQLPMALDILDWVLLKKE